MAAGATETAGATAEASPGDGNVADGRGTAPLLAATTGALTLGSDGFATGSGAGGSDLA
ncbi:MAG: hypothetical protein FJ102_05605, partial [Deltaproteobacteria bacterium]|nr:hypothetical protein [Deltaproteobacteria bacterium]